MGKAKQTFGGRCNCIGYQRKGKTKDKRFAEAAADAAVERLAAVEMHAPPPPPEPAVAEPPETEQATKHRQCHTSPEEERRKRAAIEFAYIQLNSPPKELWDGPDGTVSQIRELGRARRVGGAPHVHVPKKGHFCQL